ncbi:hypothetical protein jhhlp_000621 [Lomentospora prolificans]|uniref:Cell wall protein PhiA n=1 Tax=Lomentospora prolificans TaxID=41688 RepID=A0A2N3NJ00_9PEZI|nr:hypothetical protein jhhlp_000621 [Lomentospora prolificans]
MRPSQKSRGARSAMKWRRAGSTWVDDVSPAREEAVIWTLRLIQISHHNMQLRALLPALVGLATASTIEDGDTFNLMALRSASAIHFANFNAALSSVFLRLPEQNATCNSESDGSATFYLKDGGLYLYDDNSADPQQLFVDRSGMGQGKFGYTTGSQAAPRNSERETFELDEYDDLTFNGAGFLACPSSIGGAFSVWVSAGVENPGGNEGCLGMSVRAVKNDDPNSCVYTQ